MKPTPYLQVPYEGKPLQFILLSYKKEGLQIAKDSI
jgi:hypothetical protein